MENSVFHSHSSLCYSKISNPLSGGVPVHFIVGSNGLRYIVVQETMGYISTMSGEWLQRLWSYIQHMSRCQENASTTCLYPYLMSGGRRSGTGRSGVGSDL